MPNIARVAAMPIQIQRRALIGWSTALKFDAASQAPAIADPKKVATVIW